tara:strand:+ start:223 stop:417 length:195 start_codon:yes stop_codon:yes gene_type:complete
MNKYLEENITKEQKDSIEHLKGKWSRIGEPQPMLCGDGAVVVECFYESGASMYIAIEKDGHRHS